MERNERSKNDKRKKEQGGMGRKGGREAVPLEETRREMEREEGPLPVTCWISGIALRIRNMPS